VKPAYWSISSVLMVATLMIGPADARQPSAFEIALQDGDIKGAAEQIDHLNMAVGRRKDGRLLDAYYGRFFSALAKGWVAEPYLVRAIAVAKDASEHDALAFELARAREVDGFVDKAIADYQRLASQGRDPEIRDQATLSLARLGLSANLEETIARLSPLTSGSSPLSVRWEALVLLSRAHAMLGHAAESKMAIEAAWSIAPSTNRPASAIGITAMDMALDRTAPGDRRNGISLLSKGLGTIRFAGISQLPVCGEAVRPEDSVTLAITADEKRRPIYSVVRASRAAIAPFFTGPLAASVQRVDGDAIYVQLRCRSTPDTGQRFFGGATPDLGSWLAEKGFYPLLRPFNPMDGEPVAQIRSQLADQERLDGPQSPSLIPALMQLAVAQCAQSRFGNQAAFAEAKATVARALQILISAGAPLEIIEQLRVQTTLLLAQNGNISDVAGPAAIDSLSAIVGRVGTTPEQAYAAFDGMSRWNLRSTDKVSLADKLLGFFDERRVGANAPIRQAVELRRAATMRDMGTVNQLGERLGAHGIGAELCPTMDRLPAIPPTAITLTSEDYPKDALRYSIMGISTVELSLSATGQIENQRVIVSQPVGVFDAIALEKLKGVTLFPAQRDGRATACRGYLQTIRWQVPSDAENLSYLNGIYDQQE